MSKAREDFREMLENALSKQGPFIVSPGGDRCIAQVFGDSDGGYHIVVERRWVCPVRNCNGVAAAVDVTLESDSIDMNDWFAAEDTEDENGGRIVAGDRYTYDEYQTLAWEMFYQDESRRWATEICEQLAGC